MYVELAGADALGAERGLKVLRSFTGDSWSALRGIRAQPWVAALFNWPTIDCASASHPRPVHRIVPSRGP
jgi:hypothetical protein